MGRAPITVWGWRRKVRFIDMCRRLDAISLVRAEAEHVALRRDFALFCQPTLQQLSGGGLDKLDGSSTANLNLAGADFLQAEDLFLERLHRVLAASNMQILSRTLAKDADLYGYNLDVDLTIMPSRLDSLFIQRFHKRHESDPGFREAAGLTKHVLVYHRGIGQDSTNGFFLMQKIDHIISKLFALIWAVVSMVFRMLKVWELGSLYKTAMDTLGEAEDDADDDGAQYDGDGDGPERTKSARRQTLEQTLNRSWTAYFQMVTLYEPTFKEVLLVYRTKKDVGFAGSDDSMAHPIHVTCFRDIPIADFEVVVPMVRASVRSTDLLKMIASVLGCVYAVVIKLLEEEDDQVGPTSANTNSDFGIDGAWQTIAAIGSYAVKMVMNYMTAQKQYEVLVTQVLFSKYMVEGDAVRAYLLNALHQQAYKTMMLAYFFVWQKRASEIGQLDQEIESFLEKHGDMVDFKVVDTIKRLAKDGLLQVDGEITNSTFVTALSVRRAQGRLDDIWKTQFENKDIECPYCPYMSHDQH